MSSIVIEGIRTLSFIYLFIYLLIFRNFKKKKTQLQLLTYLKKEFDILNNQLITKKLSKG